MGYGDWSKRYVVELGIQRMVDDLEKKGLPTEWPLRVPDVTAPFTLKATVTASNYKSQCPYYRGYWLHGGCGGVECAAAGEIVPGVVWYNICSKEYAGCPFYKEKEERENDNRKSNQAAAGGI